MNYFIEIRTISNDEKVPTIEKSISMQAKDMDEAIKFIEEITIATALFMYGWNNYLTELPFKAISAVAWTDADISEIIGEKEWSNFEYDQWKQLRKVSITKDAMLTNLQN